MKSKIIYSVLFVLAAILPTSCDKDTEGMTFVTYHPSLTLEGETTMIVDKGSTYEEPGYSAELIGEDVTDQVVVTSDLNTSKSGIYTITYAYTNVDGFITSSTRTVIVLDPNHPIEGYWVTDPNSYRNAYTYDDDDITVIATRTTLYGEGDYEGTYDVLIIDNEDGTYYVDDFLGGWYRDRFNYGSNYAMSGTIAIDGSTVTMVKCNKLVAWGDKLDSWNAGTYDADTNTLYWDVSYAGSYEFFVTMYKK